jgi:phage terminase large subunit-like protein
VTLLERLAGLTKEQRAQALGALSDAEIYELLHTWRGFLARPEQLSPIPRPFGAKQLWRTWLVLAGRGFGKTRTLSEFIREEVDSGRCRMAHLVAPTSADARDVLVEGPAGLLSVWPENQRPIYEPSKRRVLFHTGAMATLFSGEDPDSLRGPQCDTGGIDEIAAYAYAKEVWDMFSFGLRLGRNPRAIVTTTPRPTPIIRQLVNDPTTVVTRGSTYANRANLAPSFIHDMKRRYEGTRLGRQELLGEILEDVEGALWTIALLDATRVRELPCPLGRIVVGVDPSAGSEESNDEQGIGVVGMGTGEYADHIFALADRTCKKSPEGWGRAAVQAAIDYKADCIAVERNCGGDMARSVIEYAAKDMKVAIRVKDVTATRGKHVRAEPIAAVWEQGRGHMVGTHPGLEDELCAFTAAGYTGAKSPNRADGLVWAATELLEGDRRIASNLKKSGHGNVLVVD